tara:strand:- start:326 stop:496 length:171 start_codon:yes stop_codon:yes gene_type:complete
MKVFIVLKEFDDTGFSKDINIFSNIIDAEAFKRKTELDYVFIMHFKCAIIIEEIVK